MVFGYRNIKPVRRKRNVSTFQMAEFIQPQASSIKDRTGEACFRIAKGIQKESNLAPVRDKGQIGTELSERDL